MLGLVIYTKDFASTIDDFLYNLCVTAWHTQTLEPKKFDRSFSQILNVYVDAADTTGK